MSDDWCLDCLEEFHLDDTGGYNPPCACGKCVGLCRSCCRAEELPDDDYERPEESHPDGGGMGDLSVKLARILDCVIVESQKSPGADYDKIIPEIVRLVRAAPQGETE